MRLIKKNYIQYTGKVYDIKVNSNDHSYTVNNCVVHNSAGGSLISYLLMITHLDPLKYGLLFSRFMNEGRLTKTLPDIDVDFEAMRRDEVKNYVMKKYGVNHFCSIGSYTTIQLKAALKDIGRVDGIDVQTVNFVNKFYDDNSNKFEDIIQTAVDKPTVKSFVKKYPNTINAAGLVLGQNRAKSVHPCATLILPDFDKNGNYIDMFSQIPLRLEGNDLVSEWEGVELEAAGFLKEDILGIKQLDKFKFILELIEKNNNKKIDIYKINLEEKDVYRYFQNGWNGDVFHFGSIGLTGYCKELKPENMEDLISANSLYRPGAMENNFHNEFIFRKNGKKKVEFYIGSENVLKETYGVFVFQEQIMKLCQVLGGLTMVEADDVRKAMVKKDYDSLHKYKDRFIKYYVETFNVSEEYSKEVWETIDRASTYLFNKSHAAAYSITGYICQWFKVHYPLEFWTSAFEFDPKDKTSKLSRYISEINNSDTLVKVSTPDINKSTETFFSDTKTKTIYWSITGIKFVGDTATGVIMVEREKNGEFFSFMEFLTRVPKGKVNKRVIENLIFSGAFDNIENISSPLERVNLFSQYNDFVKKEEFILSELGNSKYWWVLKQKEVCGYGHLDYKELISTYLPKQIENYIDFIDLQSESSSERKLVCVGGIIEFIRTRETKKGEMAEISLSNNEDPILITMWPEKWGDLKSELFDKQGKILLITGVIKYSKYNSCNIIETSESTNILILK